MSQFLANSTVFEPEYLEGFREIYEEKIVFDRTLGLRLVSVSPEEVVARIEMRPDLVGHYAYNRIHGGVISALLDVIGSAAVMACTIDLRVDYLRPGIGDYFTIHAQALRVGTRVGTSRMEFRGPDGTLMSTGTGAYIVS